jgi:hypothetical protein
MRCRIPSVGLLVVAVGLALLPSSASLATGRLSGVDPLKSTVGPRADFNGDGFGDLAVGAPGEDLGSLSNAGGVNVIYGASSGLASAGNQFWSQNSSGVKGTAETNDAFGRAVATGDFNHDGFSDLAVGAPFDSVGSVASAGAVNVLYGRATGLSASGNQQWDQDSKGVRNAADANDDFGFALAARDFNDDGFTDLAIGVPGEDGKTSADVGAVNVLYGSASGLSAKGDQYISGAQAGDRFGTALAAGNFDGAHGQDLAVGAPDATNDGAAGAGTVFWMSGTTSGLIGFHFTVNSVHEAGEHCGTSLASFNWDNDAAGDADVVAGCPNATAQGKDDAGNVDVHLGSGAGLSNGIGVFDSPDIQAGAEFGSSLAAADVGNDQGGSDDLVVGEPLFDVGSQPDAGRVVMIYDNGGASFQVIRQGLNGTLGTAEGGDIFGAAVTTGNFDGDGFADIAVGVPGEGVGGSTNGEGGVNVLYGSATGITSSGNQFWSQNTAGILGTAEPEDFFGQALSGRNE